MPIIQSLDRALAMMDLFDENHRALKITEISSRMGLHKSTVHSLLKTLQKHRYIEQDEQGLYRLGIRLIEKGQLLLQSFDIRDIASGALRELSEETGQSVHLVVRDGAQGVYIDKVEGRRAAIRYSRIGRRVPLHSSAVGKVLAAFTPDEDLEQLLKDYEYSRRTLHTISNEAAFREELRTVRESGVGFDREENEPGVRCVAAPVYDHGGHVAAAVSVSTLTATVDSEELAAFTERLRETAERISAGLGFRRK